MNGHIFETFRLIIKRGDITEESADAIVNAANTALAGGGGVDGAIHGAGGPSIAAECRDIIKRIGRLSTGSAAATTAGSLSAKYIIHAVGPIWLNGGDTELAALRSAYENSIEEARKLGAATICFPAISAGAYGFPPEAAAKAALAAVTGSLNKEPGTIKEVRFILFSTHLYEVFENELKKYINGEGGEKC